MRYRTKKQVTDSNDPISAEKVLADILISSNNLPEWAICLAGLRHREDLTQKEFAELLGLKQSNVSLMERGKRPIGKQLAMKLAKFFKTDYRLFL